MELTMCAGRVQSLRVPPEPFGRPVTPFGASRRVGNKTDLNGQCEHSAEYSVPIRPKESAENVPAARPASVDARPKARETHTVRGSSASCQATGDSSYSRCSSHLVTNRHGDDREQSMLGGPLDGLSRYRASLSNRKRSISMQPILMRATGQSITRNRAGSNWSGLRQRARRSGEARMRRTTSTPESPSHAI